GYLGFPNHPFANYYPPWVKDPAAYGLKSSKSVNSDTSSLSLILILLGSTILATEVLINKKFISKEMITKLIKR
ncbi:hypothetical protein DJ530_12710, partial [Sulfolobus sp. E1]